MRRFRDFRRRRQERKGYHVRRTIYTNNVEANSHIRYPPNYISTTRYNIITFLPKNLWEQFHRVANVFFVVMMILSVTPISPVIPGPQVAAVVAILGFQAIKDAYVDWKRHKQDKEINGRTVFEIFLSLTSSLFPSSLVFPLTDFFFFFFFFSLFLVLFFP